MNFLNLVTLPDATDFLASTTEWSSPIFTEFLPLLYLVCGLAIGIGVVAIIMHWFGGIFKR